MKKFILIVSIFLALVLSAAIILPIIYKGKILSLLKSEINTNLTATVNFDDDIELSLLKSFPNFTLGVHKLSVVGKADFKGDTLVAINKLEVVVDVMSVIKGDQINIRKIALNQPRVHALVLTNGKANWDITKPSTDTTVTSTDTSSARFNVKLKNLLIEDGYIVYDDKAMGVYTLLDGFNYEMSGDFTQDDFLLQIKSNINQWSLAYGGIGYLNKVKSGINVDLNMNMPNMKFTFNQNSISLNELVFNFDGFVQMLNDDINLDLKYGAPNASFKSFLSLVPGMYTREFSDIQTAGMLGFNGTAKGTYNETSLPAFTFNLTVADAMFKYPSLPMPVKDIQVNLQVKNPDGNLNNTQVNLSKFHLDIAGDAFDAKLIATNIMQDPHIDSWLKGRVNLGNVTKIVPLETGMTVDGTIAADVTAQGKVSAIEKQQFDQFNASGQIVAQNIRFKSTDLPDGVNSNEITLLFNPKSVILKNADAVIGKSDFKLAGEIHNFFPYLFSNGILGGNLTLNSTLIDANQFLVSDPNGTAPSAEDTTSLSAPEIPANIAFDFVSNIGKLLYSNLEINQLKGGISTANQQLQFKTISLNTLGAGIKMNGYYETVNPIKPTAQLDFSIDNMDIQLASKTFNTIKKLAPVIEKTNGTFSTALTFSTEFDSHLNCILNSVNANGTLKLADAQISSVKLMDEIANVLKNDNYRKLSLRNVAIKYEVKEGRIYTQPFSVNAGGKSLLLSGSTGIDQTIDYKGSTTIQRSELGKVNAELENVLQKLNTKAGSSVKLDENLAIDLFIGGTFTKPVIRTNLADLAKNQMNSLKDQAKDELNRQKQMLEEKAKAEADRLKKEAEAKAKAELDKAKQQADKAKQQAEAEAERLKKEAEAKAQAEKERLKKQAEEEAKKKIKGIFTKP